MSDVVCRGTGAVPGPDLGGEVVGVGWGGGVLASGGGGPGAGAVGVEVDGPVGVVFEEVVEAAEGVEVVDGGGAVGVGDDVVEVALGGGGGAAGEAAVVVAGADGAGEGFAGAVGG